MEPKTPVTIPSHIPTRPHPSQADLEALRVAGEKMQSLIAASGATDEEIVGDFKALRRQKRSLKP